MVQFGAHNTITNEVDAVNELEKRLSDAIKLQSLADVPLGAFLSGGVDSSAIVALMQQQATSLADIWLQCLMHWLLAGLLNV